MSTYNDLIELVREVRRECNDLAEQWKGYKEQWMEVLSDDVHFKTARIFDTYDDFVAYHSDNPLTRHIEVEVIRILVPPMGDEETS